MKKKQLKSLWGFFKSTLLFGFQAATSDEIKYRRLTCITCPNVVANNKGNPACGICGCRVEWRIKPTASYCPAMPPRWTAVKRDFVFSAWLRSVFYRKSP